MIMWWNERHSRSVHILGGLDAPDHSVGATVAAERTDTVRYTSHERERGEHDDEGTAGDRRPDHCLVSIALGIVLAVRPDIGALTLATVFGLFCIVDGISALVPSAHTRSLGADEQGLIEA